MKTIKVSEATVPVLNWLVAKCEGVEWWAAEEPRKGIFLDYARTVRYEPSTDWAQGGPIKESNHIGTYYYQLPEPGWAASVFGLPTYSGPTELVAAMRCYVASKLGETVEVPEELA